MSLRPERQAPPEIFYNDAEARKYTTSSRMIDIQAKLTKRAIELLALPGDGVPRLLLDIGCGSGLSGETLSEHGHHWIGMDISESMINVAIERDPGGDLMVSDIGQGLNFRPGTLDGAISISAVQWLCNADKSCNDPRSRLKAFFSSLYKCLSRGARAILQIYPENSKQLEMISTAAMRTGFSGGLVVDFPNRLAGPSSWFDVWVFFHLWSFLSGNITQLGLYMCSSKAKKYFLCLMCGPPSVSNTLPKAKGMDGEDSQSDEEDSDGEENGTVDMLERQRPAKRMKHKLKIKGRAWLLKKKEQRRQRGVLNVPQDTKYTGRKRKTRF